MTQCTHIATTMDPIIVGAVAKAKRHTPNPPEQMIRHCNTRAPRRKQNAGVTASHPKAVWIIHPMRLVEVEKDMNSPS
jgi:hypothetical protein